MQYCVIKQNVKKTCNTQQIMTLRYFMIPNYRYVNINVLNQSNTSVTSQVFSVADDFIHGHVCF